LGIITDITIREDGHIYCMGYIIEEGMLLLGRAQLKSGVILCYPREREYSKLVEPPMQVEVRIPLGAIKDIAQVDKSFLMECLR